MIGEHTQNPAPDAERKRGGRGAPDWSRRTPSDWTARRPRFAPTILQLEAALAPFRRTRQWPAEVEALLEKREIAFVVAAMARCPSAHRRLERLDIAIYRAATAAASGR
jgi:predicted transcriptional regulator